MRYLVILRFLVAVACVSTTGGTYTHQAATVTSDTDWLNGTHNVNGTITFSNAKLTIQAGATVRMAPSASIVLGQNASIEVLGTSDRPVQFTSQALAPERGDWGAIQISQGSKSANSIAYANFSYGGGSNLKATLQLDDGTALRLTNSRIENSASFGIAVNGDADLTGFAGNALTRNTQGPITLAADSVGLLGPGTYGPNDSEGIQIPNSAIAHSATWSNLGTPYILETVNIQSLTNDVVLTVGAGVTLLMQNNASILVGRRGGLSLAGTATSKVSVSSVANPANRGDWSNLWFASDSLGAMNSISYTELSYGGGQSNQGTVYLESGAKLSMVNTAINNSADFGVQVTAGATLVNFSSNTLLNNTLQPIAIDVDSVGQLSTFIDNTYSADGIYVTGSALRHDSVWQDLNTPYDISEPFDIAGSGSQKTTLTLAAGAELHFAASAGIVVNPLGSLLCLGTAGRTVVLTASSHLDPWSAIDVLTDETVKFIYTRFEYGGSSARGQLHLQRTTDVSVSNISFGPYASGSCNWVDCTNNASLNLPSQTPCTTSTCD